MHPVMPRQAGAVQEQVADGDALGCGAVVQAKLRNVVAHGRVPVEAPRVGQDRQAGGGERLGQRADWEQRVRGDGQAGFLVAPPEAMQRAKFIPLDDGNGQPWDVPVGHGLGDEGRDGVQGPGLLIRQTIPTCCAST